MKISISPFRISKIFLRMVLTVSIGLFLLSRYVDVNDGDKPRSGVLLVDMKYSVIEDVLKQINDSSEGIYYYLCQPRWRNYLPSEKSRDGPRAF